MRWILVEQILLRFLKLRNLLAPLELLVPPRAISGVIHHFGDLLVNGNESLGREIVGSWRRSLFFDGPDSTSCSFKAERLVLALDAAR